MLFYKPKLAQIWINNFHMALWHIIIQTQGLFFTKARPNLDALKPETEQTDVRSVRGV